MPGCSLTGRRGWPCFTRSDVALTLLFVQVWLFGLCLCGFESELFNGGSIVWFMSVVAIIGLHYQATAELAPVRA